MIDDRLVEITTELGSTYEAWKEFESVKNEFRGKFFDWINTNFNTPAEKYAELSMRGATEEEARKRFEQYYPKWIVDEIRISENGWEAILTEKPEYTAFTFVNP